MAATDKVPAIYGAIHKVIAELQVEKDGVLPGTKGGKSYRSAEAFTTAIKALFVKHGIIFIANEEVVDQGYYEFKSRMTYFTVIRGEYRLISTLDGSELTVSGIGRGNDIGATTDANIASTFAFKNAMQRTLLIGDNSAEEAGMRDGSSAGPNAVEKAAARAAATPKAKPTARAKSPEVQAREAIKKEFMGEDGPLTVEQAQAEVERLKLEGSKTPNQDFLKALRNGDLPNG